MKFKQFLWEESHRTPIEVEDVESLLKAHCKDALKHFETPIWRGTRNSSADAYLIHGEADSATGRRSKNTTNYYTNIMDKFLPYFGYPKRSKSIICGNNDNKDYAESFGSVYAIFPYDGVPIGVCQSHDLWQTDRFKIGKHPDNNRIDDWNDIFRHYGLLSANYEDFKDSLEEAMSEDTPKGHDLLKWFGPPEKIDTVFAEAYSPENLHLELTNSAHINAIPGAHELWIGGKCIAIHQYTWKKMMEQRESA